MGLTSDSPRKGEDQTTNDQNAQYMIHRRLMWLTKKAKTTNNSIPNKNSRTDDDRINILARHFSVAYSPELKNVLPLPHLRPSERRMN